MTPLSTIAAGITSQFDRWPDTNTTGFPSLEISRIRSTLTISTRPVEGRILSISGNSAKARPRFSHWSASTFSRQAASFSGKASSILRRASRWVPLKGPKLRISQPPKADATSTPINLTRPVNRSKPSASRRHARSCPQGFFAFAITALLEGSSETHKRTVNSRAWPLGLGAGTEPNFAARGRGACGASLGARLAAHGPSRSVLGRRPAISGSGALSHG